MFLFNLQSEGRNMPPQNFDVVLLGHFAKDKDVIDGKERDVLGGAVYYGAFPLKMMGIKVGTSKSNLSRARDILQQKVKLYFDTSEHIIR